MTQIDHTAEQQGQGDALDLALGAGSNFRDSDGSVAPLPAAEMPEPGSGEPVAYEDRKAEDLQVEADRRGLDVEGTGKDGNVLKADLVKALQADDAK